MESLLPFLRTLGELGFTPLNIALILMLYFLGAQQGLFPRFWGSKEKEEEDVPAWAGQLLQYFNHDTTEHHEVTHKKLDDIVRAMAEHNKLDERVITLLENQEKYGVVCRSKV